MYAYYGEVMEINKIEQELLKLITKAKDKNEVPIAALIVKNDKIISKFYNKVNKSNNILDHAEILVIKKASKKLHNWRLDDCDLYVTLEPCMMCTGAIIQSRMSRLVIGTNVSRWPGFIELIENNPVNHHPDVQQGILKEQCATIVSEFFKRKRRK